MHSQRSTIKELARRTKRKYRPPRPVDIRWVSLPIVSFLAYTVGDVSLWVIGLVLVGSFEINLKF